MRQYHVAVLVGSLRQASYNRKVAKVLSEVAPEALQLTQVPIGELDMFNEDVEATPPAAWETFRAQIRAADAVLFVTPEYNRSVPAVLKNALDVGSRPYGQSVWGGKPGGVVSVSIGSTGGFGANHHLRQALVFLDIPVLQQPEAYIAHAHTLFDEQDQLNAASRTFLSKYMHAYSAWVIRNSQK